MSNFNGCVVVDNGHGTRQYMKGSKQSPDGSLYEGEWCRELAKLLNEELTKQGIKNYILVPEDKDISITTRIKRANKIAAENKNTILVSIHNNASGNDGKWHNASGFSVFVSKNASTKSKKLASFMTDEAIRNKMIGNRSIPKEKYWTWGWTKNDIALLKSTTCPAVLTENFFLDNKADVEYLLSDEGKKLIVDLHVNAIKKYYENNN